jgi:hypothetical protein
MHTICELFTFQSAAEEAGMSRDEIDQFIDEISLDPSIGDVIAGTGGCRKVRTYGKGRGKSGGFRVITFFTGENLPVFLISVFGKGEKANLSQAECNALARLTKVLVKEYRRKVVKIGAGG